RESGQPSFRVGRLIPSIAPARTRKPWSGEIRPRSFAWRNRAALFSPALARRFPFFAPLWTRRRVSFRFGGGQMGRLPHDDQSQRALGIDTGDRTVGMFRSSIANNGSRSRPDFEIGQRDSRKIRQTDDTALET